MSFSLKFSAPKKQNTNESSTKKTTGLTFDDPQEGLQIPKSKAKNLKPFTIKQPDSKETSLSKDFNENISIEESPSMEDEIAEMFGKPKADIKPTYTPGLSLQGGQKIDSSKTNPPSSRYMDKILLVAKRRQIERDIVFEKAQKKKCEEEKKEEEEETEEVFITSAYKKVLEERAKVEKELEQEEKNYNQSNNKKNYGDFRNRVLNEKI